MIIVWTGYIALIIALLALDLGVFHRHAHVISIKEALGWSVFWIFLGLSFSVFVYFGYEYHWLGLGSGIDAVDGVINDGQSAVVKYITGYVVEKSLSVDNIFVIALIFSFMGVPPLYQHRVLFWGIIGALFLRGAMIGIGATLISQFHWILYIFGVFLIVTAIKMLVMDSHEQDPSQNKIVKWVRKYFPVSDAFHDERFILKVGSAGSKAMAETDAAIRNALPGTIMLTPLAISLIIVETSDVVFAVDSIPAIFSITADPFLVFTSNVFAILGLRSLYFALARMLDQFKYLKPALALVLFVVGAKMLCAEWLKHMLGKHFDLYLLATVLGILAIGVVASIVSNRRKS